MKKHTFFLATCISFTLLYSSDACSCQPTHPQQQFCDADFVILARIKRENVVNETREYKIRIRKEYKMSEKSYVALKYGRLLTAAESSMCGIKLDVGQLYAISGKVLSLQARINMCGLMEKWDDLSKRQRKGLKLMYKQGCSCGIKFCPPHRRCTRTKNACNWDTWRPNKKKDCQRNEGLCLRAASKQCLWSKSASLTGCTKNITVMHHEPTIKARKQVVISQRRMHLPFRDDRGKKFGQ